MAVSEDQLSLACENSKLVQQILAEQLLILLRGRSASVRVDLCGTLKYSISQGF